jgi:cell filamentation protein
LGIRRKTDADQAEFEALLRVQAAYLKRVSPATRFTAEMICRMHRDWLCEIYEWAGQYRTVELEKGCFKWPPASRVPQNMEVFGKGLLARHTPCRPGPLPEVCRRIAEVHSELLLTHPFREGNGRLARLLADLMAMQAGLPAPVYGFTGRGAKKQRTRYLECVNGGYVGDYDALTDFFRAAIERRLRDGRGT